MVMENGMYLFENGKQILRENVNYMCYFVTNLRLACRET